MIKLLLVVSILASLVGLSCQHNVPPIGNSHAPSQQLTKRQASATQAPQNLVNSNSQQPKQQTNQTEPAAEPPRRQQAADDEYLIGVGIADITGPAADINLVSLIRLLANLDTSSSSSSSSLISELIRFQYPSWRELRDIKLQLRINLNSFYQRQPFVANLIRWAMPNQIKMQAEYTYANLVVQL